MAGLSLRSSKPPRSIIEEGDKVDHILFEGNRRPVRMINNQAGRQGKDYKMVGKLSEQRAVWDPHTRIADLDMLVTFHLGARVPRFGDVQHFLPDMPMSKMAMAEPIGIVIFNGIFERFPMLKIASVESGVGWFAEHTTRTREKQRF